MTKTILILDNDFLIDIFGRILLHLTAGQTRDYKGAAAFVDSFPSAKDLLADRGYALQTAPQNRKHVRMDQGLTQNCHALRQVRPHLLLRRLHRSKRHLLAYNQ